MPPLPTVAEGDPNHDDVHNDERARINDLDTRYRTGTGYPEGVVTAPVGTEYTDTAATNGAIKWVKATGTGNTGWRVSVGDTGERIIAIPTATSGTVRLRRVNNTVVCLLSALVLPAGSGPFLIFTGAGTPIPVGFRPRAVDRSFYFVGKVNDAVIPERIGVYEDTEMTWAGTGVTFGGGRPAVGLQGVVSWPTTSAWPSTLPGTAV